MSSNSLVVPPHDLELSLNYKDGAGFSLSWSVGRSRMFFDTDSTEVAAALLRRRVEMTLDEFTACLVEELSLDPDRVLAIVADLTQRGFFGDGAHHPTDHDWIRFGWADALAVHRATASSRSAPQPGGRPPPYRPRSGVSITLPDPVPLTARCDEVRTRRRTHRDFRDTTASLVDIATIAAWTLPKERPLVGYFLFDGLEHETAPPQRFAAYAYDPESHRLIFVNASDGVHGWSSLLWGQSFGNGAPVAFVLAADWHQYMWMYPTPRAYRWVFSDLGSSMHTAITVGTALGLKAFQTASIDDSRLCALLKLDPGLVYPGYWANFGRTSAA